MKIPDDMDCEQVFIPLSGMVRRSTVMKKPNPTTKEGETQQQQKKDDDETPPPSPRPDDLPDTDNDDDDEDSGQELSHCECQRCRN